MQREILSKRKPRKISFRYKGGAEKAGERREKDWETKPVEESNERAML